LALVTRKSRKVEFQAKIKIFLWLVVNNAILTKDNMIKRKWQGDPKCYLCALDETVSSAFSV
jgi:hypothetical protein